MKPYPKDPHTMKPRRSYNRLIPMFTAFKEVPPFMWRAGRVEHVLRLPYSQKEIKKGSIAYVENFYFYNNDLFFKEMRKVEVNNSKAFIKHLEEKTIR